MSKPEDIPQDVWESADNAVHTFCNNHHLWGDLGSEGVLDLHTVIARAIMAAKAEEREACAETGAHAAEPFVRYKVGSAWSDEAGNAVEVSILKRGDPS